MKIAVPKEIYPGEKRVAATPESVKTLKKLGFTVMVERNAGEAASFGDGQYIANGAVVVETADSLWRDADIVLKVRAPYLDPVSKVNEVDLLPENSYIIGLLNPAQNPELLDDIQNKKATALSMDAVPRITRAQKLDVLSSMANIAGYRAVIEAASHFGRLFTGQMTAAGQMPPAKILLIGAGVAGLSIIGVASGMGAVVRVFDTRPEVKEQVESLGGKFLELDFKEDGSSEGGYAKVMSKAFIKAEMELFAAQAKEVDIIITTALIPGKKAPLLITTQMVESMKQGSVIVDMAAENGGNCALTQPNKVAVVHGVSIIGYTDLPSRMASQSSLLYATNLAHLLTELCPGRDGKLVVDVEDDLIRPIVAVYEGELAWPPPKPKVAAIAPVKPVADKKLESPIVDNKKESERDKNKRIAWITVLGGLGLFAIGSPAPESFLSHLMVFVLSCFVGYQVIWNVTPALHTPLMSLINAISGMIVVGALLLVSGPTASPVTILAGLAVFVATINIAGGFLVTQRMLRMFNR
ncbi:MAG: Re/Si-specific NAD(P)(+) transhydrogenase subunit alpha [Magnetococcales bacterium]|nr:Re/Si-specific NAD(P)(+) transhydrogenase subunit alpha [Magnetococcales bacterium]